MKMSFSSRNFSFVRAKSCVSIVSKLQPQAAHSAQQPPQHRNPMPAAMAPLVVRAGADTGTWPRLGNFPIESVENRTARSPRCRADSTPKGPNWPRGLASDSGAFQLVRGMRFQGFSQKSRFPGDCRKKNTKIASSLKIANLQECTFYVFFLLK